MKLPHPARSTRTRLGALLLGLAAALVPLGCARHAGEPALGALEWINTDAPPASLAALAGKPVVVEFWATWCPPCEASTPHLVELAKRHAARGLVVLGVHHPRSLDKDAVADFVERFEIPYAIGLDHDGTLTQAYGVQGIPDAFVYDRAGALLWRGHPLDGAFDEAVRRAVE